jgi:glycosyltransferase involved in cell wall biosynthesis
MASDRSPSISVAQLGARMHYAVPRILQNAGMLHRLYTDACATKGLPRLLRNIITKGLRPAPLRRLLERIPKGIPPSKVTAFTSFGVRETLRRYRLSSLSEQTAHYLWTGREFSRRIIENGDFGGVDGIYGFKMVALEILTEGKKHGLKTILEQPNVNRQVMHDLLKEEHRLHPGWAEPREEDKYLQKESDREREEWSKADLILCPSEFVKEGIRKVDGPTERAAVVPYGVDFQVRDHPRRQPERPLHVLSAGTVSLRKGVPYLLDAARQSSAYFRMVGEINLAEEGRDQLSTEIELPGKVPRSRIHDHYKWADVFVLPSICEGSATVIYEALAHALPVICTPNTGSIVRDGTDGFIVPIREADPIADRLEQLASDPELYRSMSEAALERYRQEGTLEAYGRRLTSSIRCALDS